MESTSLVAQLGREAARRGWRQWTAADEVKAQEVARQAAQSLRAQGLEARVLDGVVAL